jgi:hypothetical protein
MSPSPGSGANEIETQLKPAVAPVVVPDLVDQTRLFGLSGEMAASYPSLDLSIRDFIFLLPAPVAPRKKPRIRPGRHQAAARNGAQSAPAHHRGGRFMAKTVSLQVSQRAGIGRTALKAVRKAGRVPGMLYGKAKDKGRPLAPD